MGTTRRQQITELTTKRQQCEMEDDQETCRAGWDVKIEAKRAYYEEQTEILREERDTEMEHTRVTMEETLTQVRTTKTKEIQTIQQTKTAQIMKVTDERDACEGDLESCEDKYDTEINQVNIRMD